MATATRSLALAILATVALVASCNPFAAASPPQTVCGGVSSEVGGCTAERHDFTGDTCDALAEEWAEALDRAIVAVLVGPEVVNDEGRSVRIRQALVITTTDMNTRLQALGLAPDCDIAEFMAAAEPLFSSELRAGVGNALYDGAPPATYNEWLQDVDHVARMIDDGE